VDNWDAMIKIVRSKLAASEVIGVVLLLGMAVTLFVVLNMYVSSFSGTHSVPLVSLMGTLDKESKEINIENNGGESLVGTTNIMITIGNTTHQSSITEIVNHADPGVWQLLVMNPDKNPDKWDFGESVQFNFTGIDITDKHIQVIVVDPDKNTIVLSTVLQQGLSE
jgi:hypothetical protein